MDRPYPFAYRSCEAVADDQVEPMVELFYKKGYFREIICAVGVRHIYILATSLFKTGETSSAVTRLFFFHQLQFREIFHDGEDSFCALISRAVVNDDDFCDDAELPDCFFDLV